MEEKDTLAMEMLHHDKVIIIILSIIIFVLILALIISNLAWLGYESQFETSLDTKEQVIEDIDNNTDTTFSQEIN